MGWINGKTKICGIFGYPVEHSFSPAMHNAAFKNLSLNRAYVPFPVRPENLAYAVEAMRTLGLAGVNVTVPHKQAVTEFLDELSPAARLSGAVNTIVNEGGVLTGHNTDGEGFIRALAESAGSEYIRGPVLIIGAGGAARAVAVALALSGTEEIIIANRTEARAAELSSLLEESTGCRVMAFKWEGQPAEGSPEHREWAAVLDRVKLLVQTTSLGMRPAVDTYPSIPYQLVHSGQVAVDLVYNPPSTCFMNKCREAGAVVYNGTGMLLYQGAIAFELWTGREAPVDIMRRALEDSISRRG